LSSFEPEPDLLVLDPEHAANNPAARSVTPATANTLPFFIGILQ